MRSSRWRWRRPPPAAFLDHRGARDVDGARRALGVRREPALEFYGNNIVLEFVLGMMLAGLYLNGALHKIGATAGALMIALGVVGLCVGASHLELARVLVFGLPAALIVAGAARARSGTAAAR